jgi:hypothetical protein
LRRLLETAATFWNAITDQLASCITYTVEWLTKKEDGRTKVEEWEDFGQTPPEPPEVPQCAAHVWQWFHEVSSQRQTGPESLSWSDLRAWAELSGSQPTPQEIGLLVAMDRAFVGAVRKQQKEQADKYKQQNAGRR